MDQSVKIFSSDRTHVTGHVGPVFIAIARGPLTLAVHEAMQHDTEELIARFGECGYMTIIEEGCPAPPEDVRNASMKFMQRLGPKLVGVAAVIEGGGLRSATIRAVMTGITLFTRAAQPTKHFADIAAASDWLAQELKTANKPVPANTITGAVDRLRRSTARQATAI